MMTLSLQRFSAMITVRLIYFVLQIIDPFVEVEIIGLPVDCSKEQTRVVDDNGKLSQATFRGILLSFKHI